jgi:hypothetical protein
MIAALNRPLQRTISTPPVDFSRASPDLFEQSASSSLVSFGEYFSGIVIK